MVTFRYISTRLEVGHGNIMLGSINIAAYLNKNGLPDDELIELKELITERTNQRLKFIKEGKNVEDYSILLLQVISGMPGQ